MSEMSQAQGPASGGMEVNPTDDMVPPGAPRDPDSPRARGLGGRPARGLCDVDCGHGLWTHRGPPSGPVGGRLTTGRL